MLTRRRAGHDIHDLSFCETFGAKRRLESWPCDRLSKASRTWFRKSSLLAISHGCTAGSLHRAQQALLNLPTRLQTGEATGTSLSASQLLKEWHVFTLDLLCDLCAHCLKGQNVDDYLSTWHFMQASAGCLLFSKILALHREERTNLGIMIIWYNDIYGFLSLSDDYEWDWMSLRSRPCSSIEPTRDSIWIPGPICLQQFVYRNYSQPCLSRNLPKSKISQA